MLTELLGRRIGMRLDEELLLVSLAPGIYSTERTHIFLRSIGNLGRLRLGIPLPEPEAAMLAGQPALAWRLPALGEGNLARLGRSVRYLAVLVEGGSDPFEALGRLERFDVRWAELAGTLAPAFPALGPFPGPAGHLLLLAEGQTGSAAGEAAPWTHRLLLDPATSPAGIRERLLLQLHPVPGERTGRTDLVRQADRLADRLVRRLRQPWFRGCRPGDLPEEPAGAVQLEAMVSVDEREGARAGQLRALVDELEPLLAAGAEPMPGEPAPPPAPAASPAVSPLLPVALPPAAAAPPAAPAPPPPAAAAPPAAPPHRRPLTRSEELQRAHELGLPEPPEWPEHLLPLETAGRGPTPAGVAAAAALPGVAAPSPAPPPVLEDLRGSPGSPGEPREAAEDQGELAEDAPVDLVLLSAGPFPTKLRRVLSILLSVDYPKAGDLLARPPTVLLRGTRFAVARRYAQVLQQAGGRCRIERRGRGLAVP